MVAVYVNNRGWVMMYNVKTNAIKYTKHKAGAKPFESEHEKDLTELRIFIERQLMCNYDIVRL